MQTMLNDLMRRRQSLGDRLYWLKNEEKKAPCPARAAHIESVERVIAHMDRDVSKLIEVQIAIDTRRHDHWLYLIAFAVGIEKVRKLKNCTDDINLAQLLVM